MTDGEIVREYNTAKDKKTQIKIMSELTLKPKEEIIRILKENGCEVEEKRRGRKPKAEEKKADIKTAGSPRKRRSSGALKEAKRSDAEEHIQNGSAALPESSGPESLAGETIQFSSDRETAQSSSSNKVPNDSSEVPDGSSSNKAPNGSSAIPHCVWNAVRERYKYLGYSIEQLKKQIEEQSKELAELMEFIDQNGILEKDLVR